jgi:hypothetical protein
MRNISPLAVQGFKRVFAAGSAPVSKKHVSTYLSAQFFSRHQENRRTTQNSEQRPDALINRSIEAGWAMDLTNPVCPALCVVRRIHRRHFATHCLKI